VGGKQRTTLFMGVGEGKESKETEKGKGETGKEQTKGKKGKK